MPSSSQENSRKKIIEAIQQHQHQWDSSSLWQGIIDGNIAALSAAITYSESQLPVHREWTDQLIRQLLPHTGKSFRLGITGVPGVGKSTLIEELGLQWIVQGHKVAVLAIDPTSPVTHGSILGDKTRMERLSLNTNAFIRPTPSSLSLGGVATHTYEAILLCEAAGFDRIIVETVGVGQSEVAVHHLTDCFLLLMLADAGDQLQGIKRGIMEMCDVLAITKADANQIQLAQRAKSEYEQALHLFPERSDGWHPPVLTISSIEKNGIDTLIQNLEHFVEWSIPRNFNAKRNEQKKQLFKQEWLFRIQQYYQSKPGFQEKWDKVENQVTKNEISISEAMRILLDF